MNNKNGKLTRRGLLGLTLTGVYALLFNTTREVALAMAAPFLPYTSNSFFKSRVENGPVDAARTTSFRNFMNGGYPEQKGWLYPAINGVTGSSWGTVYVEGNASDPVWFLSGVMSSKVSSVVGVGKKGFHAPAYLGDILTGTSDSPACIMDRANGYTIFAGKASKKSSNTIGVLSAGITYHASNGLNGTNTLTTDKRNFTSRGRISESLVIRRDAVDYAIANNTGLGYVLQIFLVETKTTDGHCHPMTGHESSKNGWGAEGERIALKPDIDLTKRGLSPFGLAVARTLQQHGMYIGDNAGSMSALKAQQTNTKQNPWAGLTVSQQALKGLTWNDFNVIKKGWQ